ncbi:MAG: ribonuclease HII [Lewinella sp.]|nr:ribonuclease HII [Lewinella sp.]
MKLLPYLRAGRVEAGCDEAGRGCLAGPVFAAAVVLPPDFHHPLINDSKKLSVGERLRARAIIEEAAVSWGLGECSPTEIDEINIFQASYRAMHRAIAQLSPPAPEHLLIDGKFFVPFPGLSHDCIIKGDGKFLSIAAAGICQTYRDEHMLLLHQAFPSFGWDRNQGYPTAAHRAAILAHGHSIHHRLSFQLLPKPTAK